MTQFGLPLDEPMRKVDRQRHELRCLVAGIAEHQPLVACTLLEVEPASFVDTLRDVRRLFVIGHEDAAAAVVDAVLGIVVADPPDRVARDGLEVDDCLRRDLAGEHDETVLQSVSAATRAVRSWASTASSTASEIWSATLSGWPSPTDSEVKK